MQLKATYIGATVAIIQLSYVNTQELFDKHITN